MTEKSGEEVNKPTGFYTIAKVTVWHGQEVFTI